MAAPDVTDKATVAIRAFNNQLLQVLATPPCYPEFHTACCVLTTSVPTQISFSRLFEKLSHLYQ